MRFGNIGLRLAKQEQERGGETHPVLDEVLLVLAVDGGQVGALFEAGVLGPIPVPPAHAEEVAVGVVVLPGVVVEARATLWRIVT